MHELVDLLEKARPGAADVARIDVAGLVRRAKRRTVMHRAASGLAIIAALAAAAGVIQTTVQRRGAIVELASPDAASSGVAGAAAVPEPSAGAWQQVDSPLSPRRAPFMGLTDDGRLLVFGGAADRGEANAWLPDGAIYDPSTGEWAPVPPVAGQAPWLASGRFGVAALARDRLLILNGVDSGVAGAVFDLATQRWVPVPPTRGMSHYAEGVAWDGETLAVLQTGHRDDAAPDPVLLRWQFGSNGWEAGAAPPFTTRSHPAISFNGESLFVWGGSTADDDHELGKPVEGTENRGFIYDLAADDWRETALSPLPAGRLGYATWLDDSQVVVITEGAGRLNDPLEALSIYDAMNDEWRAPPPAPVGEEPRYGFGEHGNPPPPGEGFDALVAGAADGGDGGPPDFWKGSLHVYDPSAGAWLTASDAGFGQVLKAGAAYVATSVRMGNPGDNPFQVRILADGTLLAAPDAPFANRTSAGVAASDSRLYVFGGTQGSALTMMSDLWILEIGGASGDVPIADPDRASPSPGAADRRADTVPTCSPADVHFDVMGEGATAQTALYVSAVGTGGSSPCRIDAAVTLTLIEPDTGEPMDIGGNPLTGTLVGDLGPGQSVSLWTAWGQCAPGDGEDGRHEILVRASVEGFGVFDGWGITPRCGVPSAEPIQPLPPLELHQSE